jgi:hypothetical protein
MDPYAYVQGLVESATDPSGQAYARALEGFGGATGVGAATLAVPALFVFFPQGTTPTGSLTPAAGAAAAAAAAAAYQPGDAIATHTIALAGGQVETVTLYGDRIDVTVVSAQGQLVSSTTYLPNQTEYITALHQFDGDAAGAASDATDQAGVRAAEAQAGIPVAGTTGAKPGGGGAGAAGGTLSTTVAAIAASFAAALSASTTYASEDNGDEAGGYSGPIKHGDTDYHPMGAGHEDANDDIKWLARDMGIPEHLIKQAIRYVERRKKREQRGGDFHDEDWAREVLDDFLSGDR